MHMIVMLKAGDRLVTIIREMNSMYGIFMFTLRKWRRDYQRSLQLAVEELGLNKVGGKNEVVSFDETVVGVSSDSMHMIFW